MEMPSSRSVKIRYLDREAIGKALDDYVAAMAEEHPELETAILFGSFARGDSVPASDIDLLLILERSDVDFQDRIVAFLPSCFPVGMDVFPYTREEIEKMVGEGNGFISTALREGVRIYTRPSSQDG